MCGLTDHHRVVDQVLHNTVQYARDEYLLCQFICTSRLANFRSTLLAITEGLTNNFKRGVRFSVHALLPRAQNIIIFNLISE